MASCLGGAEFTLSVETSLLWDRGTASAWSSSRLDEIAKSLQDMQMSLTQE